MLFPEEQWCPGLEHLYPYSMKIIPARHLVCFNVWYSAQVLPVTMQIRKSQFLKELQIKVIVFPYHGSSHFRMGACSLLLSGK